MISSHSNDDDLMVVENEEKENKSCSKGIWQIFSVFIFVYFFH